VRAEYNAKVATFARTVEPAAQREPGED
jgi:hypothetical protein